MFNMMIEIRNKLRTELALLLFAVLFMSVGADLAAARNAAAQAGSAKPENVMSGRGNAGPGRLPGATAEPEENPLSQNAVEIARPLGFPITNSMVVTWIVAAGLIILARVATRDMEQVPSGLQNLLEWLVGGLYDFLESIIGPDLVKRTFWFFATVFIFILSANWVGLIPGVGTIGWGHLTAHGFEVDQPFFRGANADLNLTFAMALVFFFFWIIWALQEVGPVGVLKEIFAPKGESTGVSEGFDDHRVLRSRLYRNRLDLVPAHLLEFPSLWQYLCRGKHAGDHVPDEPRLRMDVADSFLFYGIAGGFGASAGLHVIVRGLYSADGSAGGRTTRRQTRPPDEDLPVD